MFLVYLFLIRYNFYIISAWPGSIKLTEIYSLPCTKQQPSLCYDYRLWRSYCACFHMCCSIAFRKNRKTTTKKLNQQKLVPNAKIPHSWRDFKNKVWNSRIQIKSRPYGMSFGYEVIVLPSHQYCPFLLLRGNT